MQRLSMHQSYPLVLLWRSMAEQTEKTGLHRGYLPSAKGLESWSFNFLYRNNLFSNNLFSWYFLQCLWMWNRSASCSNWSGLPAHLSTRLKGVPSSFRATGDVILSSPYVAATALLLNEGILSNSLTFDDVCSNYPRLPHYCTWKDGLFNDEMKVFPK